MKTLALTGPIGSGKSTVRRMFAALGIPTLCADEIVHSLQAAGTPTTLALQQAFPNHTITDSDGRISRPALAVLVQAQPEMLQRIEKILHPAVREEITRQQRAYAAKNTPLLVVEVPLLIQNGLQKEYTAVAVCMCPQHIRKQRTLARPHMSEEKWQFFNSRALPNSTYLEHADFIINTQTTQEETAAQVKAVYNAVIE